MFPFRTVTLLQYLNMHNNPLYTYMTIARTEKLGTDQAWFSWVGMHPKYPRCKL